MVENSSQLYMPVAPAYAAKGRYADGYSRDNGYYAGSSNTKEELQRLMDKATNETEKEAIRVAIESMNN